MYVRVRVTPGARKERVERVAEAEYIMSVREPAERNLANTRVRILVANALGTRERDVRLVSGHRSPVKVFDVTLK